MAHHFPWLNPPISIMFHHFHLVPWRTFHVSPFEKNGHVRGQCDGGPLRALGAGGGEEFGAAGTLGELAVWIPFGFF
jgi:hypothetical protein